MPAFLSKLTAERLRTQTRTSRSVGTGVPARGHSYDRLGVQVVCTSSTPADSSSIGKQCFPGLIVNLDATVSTQVTLASAKVWLTVLNGVGGSIVPAVGPVYECELAGPYTSGGDTRARAFCANTAVANTTAGCSGAGFLAGAMYCDSFTLTIVSQVGNMAGMPANSPLCLKWDGSGWTSTTQLVTCLGSGYVTLSRGTDGDPKLVYTTSGSGAVSYTFTFDCATSNTLYFVGGNSGTFAMCCDPAVPGGPAANNFRVAVQWSASCDTGVAAPCCPGVTIPPQLCVNITDMSGGHLAGWAGSYLLTYNGTSWFGSAVLPSGNTVGISFGCSSPSGTLQLVFGVATRGNLSTGYVTYQQFAGSGPTANCNGPTYLSGTVHSLPTNTETDGGYYLANVSVSAAACAQSTPPALCPDIASHPPLTLTDGAHTATLTWTGSAWTGTLAGFGYTLSLVAGYTWQLVGPTDTYTALSVSCGPFSAIFGPIGTPTYTVTGP